MFALLGIKTDYSLHQSLIKIDDAVSYALKNNLKCLGILDDNLNGAYAFIKKCEKKDIKPIIGLDLCIKEKHIYLYPKNSIGLSDLYKLNKYMVENEIILKVLKEYLKNVIVVLPYESISWFKYFNDAYLSFKNEDEKKECLVLTDKVIYINLAFAKDKESSKFVNYLRLHSLNKKMGDIEFINYEKNVLNTYDFDHSKFINNIDLKLASDKKYIPVYDKDISSKDYLNSLANKGLNKRFGGKVTPVYQERLNYELDIINNLGFTDYFLIVLDYIRFACKNDIYVGVGRGSAVGSLVSYSLGITWIDPLKYDLLFERFLNPMRVSMPDIDIDFEDEKREEVFKYVKEKYGDEYVAKIITYGTLKAKEVLRVVARINDVDENMISYLTKYVDSAKTLKENYENIKIKDILDKNYILKKVYNEAYHLEGLKSHISIHAAGVVISSVSLTDIVPIVKNGDEFIVGFEKDELEAMGLLKMDFLSLKTLTLITNVVRNIEKDRNTKIDINNIPLNDEKVLNVFKNANTLGIFQFESIGMQNFLRKLKIDDFSELVDAIALYRPGPMGSIDKYIEAKRTKKISYIDESLRSILEKTNGIIIYQEQIMEILSKIGGYSYQEADLVRKGISKKNLDLIESERKRFYEKSNLSLETNQKIFDLIVKFAEFGFNKSHSVAYAYVAYQMAYLKANFPEEFYAELLNSELGSSIKTKKIIEEAKENNITFIKPDINLSKDKYYINDNSIVIPLGIIKGLGNVIVNKIILNREDGYIDIYDFFKKVKDIGLNKKNLNNLFLAGVFDSFLINRNTLINNIEMLNTYADLVSSLDESLVSRPILKEYDELPDFELMKEEENLFGFYLSHHPANKYHDVVKFKDIKANFNKIIDMVLLVDNIKKIKDKNGKDMAFIDGSDETSSGSLTVFADKIDMISNINAGNLIKVKGRVERRNDKYSVIVNNINLLSEKNET